MFTILKGIHRIIKVIANSRLNFLLLITALLLLTACSQEPVVTKIAGPTMGTQYHISWVSQLNEVKAQEQERKQIQLAVDQLLQNINKSMSTYDEQSELSLINARYTREWQAISADLYRVLMMAMKVNVESKGAFDITVGPLVNLWGFGPNKTITAAPKHEAILEQLQSIGSQVINLRMLDEGFELKLQQGRYLDLSAIAKGYAVDVIARFLTQRGVNDFLVEVGGEIFASGSKPESMPWRIAIEAPNDNGRSAQMVIPLSNIGVATSGDYRNFFQQDGKRYSHTIDGRTGYPVDHGLASVTVLHNSVALADAWATALTVLGAEQGLKLANEYDLAAFFIERSKDGFKQYSSRQFEQLQLN